MDEVDVDVIDVGPELGQLVEPMLGRAPVVLIAPVAAERAQVVERNALIPPLDRLALGPSGAVKPIAKILEVGLGNDDREGLERRPSSDRRRPWARMAQ